MENRARFCLEVMDILIEVFGASNTGIKITPGISTFIFMAYVNKF